MLVSLVAKPEPVTVTEVPGAPLVRLMEITGFTVKVMSGTALGWVVAPDASIVWEPELEAGITRVLLQLPSELAETLEPSDVPS